MRSGSRKSETPWCGFRCAREAADAGVVADGIGSMRRRVLRSHGHVRVSVRGKAAGRLDQRLNRRKHRGQSFGPRPRIAPQMAMTCTTSVLF